MTKRRIYRGKKIVLNRGPGFSAVNSALLNYTLHIRQSTPWLIVEKDGKFYLVEDGLMDWILHPILSFKHNGAPDRINFRDWTPIEKP